MGISLNTTKGFATITNYKRNSLIGRLGKQNRVHLGYWKHAKLGGRGSHRKQTIKAVKASRQSPRLALCTHNRAILICISNPKHRLNCAQINK